MPPKKRITVRNKSASSSSTDKGSLPNNTRIMSLHAFPNEILLNILQYIPQNQLEKLTKVSIQLARALKCLPFLSTTQIIDLLYHGDIKPLLKPYLTNHFGFAETVTYHLQSEKFTKRFGSQSFTETCRCLLLSDALYAGGRHCYPDILQEELKEGCTRFLKGYIPPKGQYHREIKEIIVVSFASVQVLEFLTDDWSPLQRFLLSLQGNNTQTALKMFSKLYKDNLLVAEIYTHTAVRAELLDNPVDAMRLICCLAGKSLESPECLELLEEVEASQNLQLVVLDAFLGDRIPLKNPQVQLIFWMCLVGSSWAVTKLLSHPDVDPSIYNSLPLYFCLNHGSHRVVLAILEDGRVDSTSWEDEALVYAIEKRDINLVKMLLTSSRVSLSLLKLAASLGHIPIYEILLDNLETSSGIRKNDLFMVAVRANQPKIVQVLLKDPKVNPTYKKNAALKHAVKNDNHVIMCLLLDQRKVNLLANDKALLKELLCYPYAINRSEDLFTSFIYHPKVEQSLADKRIFHLILNYRLYKGLTLLLLNHPKVVIEKDDLLRVIHKKDRSLGKLFLNELRTHTSIDPDEVFRLTVQTSSAKDVELLLNDPLVDPSSENNAALRFVALEVYKIIDLEQLPKAQYPQGYVCGGNYHILFPILAARCRECNEIGRILIKHPKVQQKLAEEYPALNNPNVYTHLFSPPFPF